MTAANVPPAHPVEPEPTLVDGKPICPRCGWGGDHIFERRPGLWHCKDCQTSFTADEAARAEAAEVAQAVESGEPTFAKVRELLNDGLSAIHSEFVVYDREAAELERREHEALAELDAAEEALRLQRKRELGILAEWYRGDYLACANYCDDVLDRTGALLGRVRDAALSDSGPSKESE